MKHHAVKSSNITSIGYDPNTATMEVLFSSGALYRYRDVMPVDHHALVNAPSPGSHFAKSIRNRFKSERVETAPAQE